MWVLLAVIKMYCGLTSVPSDVKGRSLYDLLRVGVHLKCVDQSLPVCALGSPKSSTCTSQVLCGSSRKIKEI